MNNKTASAYSVSAEGPQNNQLLQKLQYAVNRHADPLQVWASYKDFDAETMDEALGCPRGTYERHVASYGKSVYSPLTTDNVLQFCIREAIHPTDLSPSICEPEHACAPHILEAIKFLSAYAHHRDDRVLAEVGLNREMQRYTTFCELYPHVKLIFDEVGEFVRDSRDDRVQFDEAIRAIDGLPKENSRTRSLLRSCFVKEARPSLLVDPRLHLEEFHMDMIARGEDQDDKLHRLKYKERIHKHDIKEGAAFLFGKSNVDLVLSTVTDMMKFFNEETTAPDQSRIRSIRDRILARYPLNIDNIKELQERGAMMKDSSPQKLVGVFVEGAYFFFVEKAKTDLRAAVIQDAKKSLREFEVWLATVQTPDFLFMQHLYCNDVTQSRQAKRVGQSAGMQQHFGQLNRN